MVPSSLRALSLSIWNLRPKIACGSPKTRRPAIVPVLGAERLMVESLLKFSVARSPLRKKPTYSPVRVEPLLDPTKGEAIRLDQNTKLTANGCSVQSNSKDRKGISAREYAFLSAERICSAGG